MQLAISHQRNKHAVIATLQKYQQLAQKYAATSLLVVATEAVRKAHNRATFLNAIQQETGLTVHILSGEIEAALTYFGAISEHQEVSDASVVDIGGGSTEFIIAQQGHIQWLLSLPIGSGWLHDHYLSSDPPTVLETDNARTFLQTIFAAIATSQKWHLRSKPETNHRNGFERPKPTRTGKAGIKG